MFPVRIYSEKVLSIFKWGKNGLKNSLNSKITCTYFEQLDSLTLISKRHFQVFPSRKNTSNLNHKVGFTIILAKQE